MTLDVSSVVELLILPALAGMAGAYFGAYLKTKGENLARHEDIKKLTEEVSAVTRITKEIEAKISNEVWDRQRQWEVKRDALFEVVRALGDVRDAVAWLHAVHETSREALMEGKANSEELDTVGEALIAYKEAIHRLDSSVLLASLSCDEELTRRLMLITTELRRLSSEAIVANFPNLVPDMKDSMTEITGVLSLVREELGIK